MSDAVKYNLFYLLQFPNNSHFLTILVKGQEEITLKRILENEYMHLTVYNEVHYRHNINLRLGLLVKPNHRGKRDNMILKYPYLSINLILAQLFE